MTRLAIITTHPIQYYAPWFRYMAQHTTLDLRVFYLWDFGTRATRDPDFGVAIEWDLPLTEGYAHQFVPNASAHPGTTRFGGMHNPTLLAEVRAFAPDAVLMMAYNYRATMEFILRWDRRRAPLMFRGDSHRIGGIRRSPRELLRRAYIAWVYRHFGACLAVGSANREYLRLHAVPESRIFTSPHAIDNARFEATPATVAEAARFRGGLGVPAGDRAALYVGKFIPRKRVADVVRAFLKAGLGERESLMLVGSGSEEASLRALANGHPKIFFAPFQNQSRMPAVLAAADIVVLPSSIETWGLILNEAMAAGRAVAATTSVGAAEDLVKDDTNGFVVRTGDVDAWAARLGTALRDSATLRRWGAASRGIVARHSYREATQGVLDALAALGREAAWR
jgi:glycosyltransferase involved in cell wall biosynthesis